MSRGNARQAILLEDIDRQRMHEKLEKTVQRCGWELFSLGFMSVNENSATAYRFSPSPSTCKNAS